MINLSKRVRIEFIGRLILLNIISICLIVVSPSCKSNPKEKSEDELWKTAQKICENNLILDAHIDWPDKHIFFPEDILKKTTKGDFDFVRANKGGLNAVLSVAYIKSNDR